jgi:hypothetical protein
MAEAVTPAPETAAVLPKPRRPQVAARTAWPPDYVEAFRWRQHQVRLHRETPALVPLAREFYRTHPVEFITDWCITYDPRNAGSGTPTTMPFIPFERQAEFVMFLYGLVQAQQNGLVEKARDMGATWLCSAFSVWLWLFWPGASVGWGSRKQELVDRLGDADSIFEKIRQIIRLLPSFFQPEGLSPKDHLTFMRCVNPENGSTITGESGDNIGRGGRKLIYFKDESAHYPRPELIEAALGDTTRVQVDISSVNGLGNVFHRKREAGVEWPGARREGREWVASPIVKGKTNVFIMDWRDHPAKTIEWYEERKRDYIDKGLSHIFNQEVDRDYASSVEGVIIPAAWVTAAIDVHLRLGLTDDGRWYGGLDVADDGGDTNALALRKGIFLRDLDEWGDSDIGETARRAIARAGSIGQPIELEYDSIGIGAGVKAEGNRLATARELPKGVTLVPWSAAAAVIKPDEHVIPRDKQSPLNKDFYANLKAQAWWQLRLRFERTYRAITEPGFTYRADELIVLPSNLPKLQQLRKELSQATRDSDGKGRLLVNKSPPGTKSPNLADSVVEAFWPVPYKNNVALFAAMAG